MVKGWICGLQKYVELADFGCENFYCSNASNFNMMTLTSYANLPTVLRPQSE